MKKSFLNATRRTVAALMLCAFFLSNSASVYADNEPLEDTTQDESSPTVQDSNPTENSYEPSEEDNSNVEIQDINKGDQSYSNTNSLNTSDENSISFSLTEDDDSDLTTPINDNELADDSLDENKTINNYEELNVGEILGSSESDENDSHTWSKWESNDNGTHTRKCQDKDCNATDTQSCNFENVVSEDGAIQIICKDCKYVKDEWNAAPTIANVSPDKDEFESDFYAPITVSAQIVCEDIVKSYGLTESSSNTEIEDAYKAGLSVQLIVEELTSDKAISIDADVTSGDGVVTYTWNVPENSDAVGVYYVIGGIIATNIDKNLTTTYTLNYNVYIPDPDEEHQRAKFTITGKNDFEYEVSDGTENWYSNQGDNDDTLTVHISGESYGNALLTIDSFTELTAGNEISFEPSAVINREYKVEYYKKFWIFTFPRSRNEITYDYEYKLPTDEENKRVLLVIQKTGKTPDIYPRKNGIISKKPL